MKLSNFRLLMSEFRRKKAYFASIFCNALDELDRQVMNKEPPVFKLSNFIDNVRMPYLFNCQLCVTDTNPDLQQVGRYFLVINQPIGEGGSGMLWLAVEIKRHNNDVEILASRFFKMKIIKSTTDPELMSKECLFPPTDDALRILYGEHQQALKSTIERSPNLVNDVISGENITERWFFDFLHGLPLGDWLLRTPVQEVPFFQERLVVALRIIMDIIILNLNYILMKDIKVDNVVVDPVTLEASLIDLEGARPLHTHPSQDNHNTTLEYAAPRSSTLSRKSSSSRMDSFLSNTKKSLPENEQIFWRSIINMPWFSHCFFGKRTALVSISDEEGIFQKLCGINNAGDGYFRDEAYSMGWMLLMIYLGENKTKEIMDATMIEIKHNPLFSPIHLTPDELNVYYESLYTKVQQYSFSIPNCNNKLIYLALEMLKPNRIERKGLITAFFELSELYFEQKSNIGFPHDFFRSLQPRHSDFENVFCYREQAHFGGDGSCSSFSEIRESDILY